MNYLLQNFVTCVHFTPVCMQGCYGAHTDQMIPPRGGLGVVAQASNSNALEREA